MNSAIMRFFRGEQDSKGRTLAAIREWSDARWEAEHDFVQWTFPLHEKSMHAVNSPIMTDDDIAYLKSDESQQERTEMVKNLERMQTFLHLTSEKSQKWWCFDGNHNLLRITRVIRSLRLFNMEEQARKFYEDVKAIAEANEINRVTLEFWRKAMEETISESLIKDFLKIKWIRV